MNRHNARPVYVGSMRFTSPTAAGDHLGMSANDVRLSIDLHGKIKGHRVSYDPPPILGRGRQEALLPGLCTMRLGAYRGGNW